MQYWKHIFTNISIADNQGTSDADLKTIVINQLNPPAFGRFQPRLLRFLIKSMTGSY